MCINLSLLTLIKTFVSRLCMPFFSLSWLWKKEQIPLCVCVCVSWGNRRLQAVGITIRLTRDYH